MRYIIVSLILLVNIYAKDCYWNKELKHQICYKRFFQLDKLKHIDKNGLYYKKNHKVYFFTDTIKIKFNFKGAIFMLLDDFNLKFLDKKLGNLYIFKVSNIHNLFSLLSQLNKQPYIKSAKPIIKFIYDMDKKNG